MAATKPAKKPADSTAGESKLAATKSGTKSATKPAGEKPAAPQLLDLAGNSYELLITGISSEGAGVAVLPEAAGQSAGKKVFVFGALPGETVTATITRDNAKFAFAQVKSATDVLTPSPDRVTPKDANYLSTSPFQIASESYELELKSDIFRQAFRLQNDPALLETVESFIGEDFISSKNFYHYRNKNIFALSVTPRGVLQLGSISRGTNDIEQTDDFSLVAPEILTAAQEAVDSYQLRTDANGTPLPPKNLIVRTTQGGNTKSAFFTDHRDINRITKKDVSLSDPLLGKKFTYGLFSFWQVNQPMYIEVLTDMSNALTELAPDATKIVDMFCGVGSIGLTLQDQLQQAGINLSLDLVESDKVSVKYANLNAGIVAGGRGSKNAGNSANNSLNSAGNSGKNSPKKSSEKSSEKSAVQVHHLRAEKASELITADSLLIVDPPRVGLAPTLVADILSAGPAAVAYLSCNPYTLARDLAALTGYRIHMLKAYNFFPRTAHIETLVVLVKK
jgi:tRNA/tmRNA/rRNA uracil-C5-methylase (TrmA/RlmC/RlmD family)